MKIKAIYENQDGQHEINAVLTEDQHKFLIEFALLELLRKGLMIPVVHNDEVTLIEFGKNTNEQTLNTELSSSN